MTAWRPQGLVLAGLLLIPSLARAACEAPVPPAASERPLRPAAPERPRCAASQSCAPGEADAYNKAVTGFNQKARDYQAATQAYAARLNAYVAAAEAYARCEVAGLNAP